MNIFFTRRRPADGSLARLAFSLLLYCREKNLGFVYLWGSFELQSVIQTEGMDFKNTGAFVSEKNARRDYHMAPWEVKDPLLVHERS